MPGVFADQDGGASAPTGLERLDLVPAVHKPFFVKDTIGRKEHLPADMPDLSLGSERGVEAGIEVAVLEDFVEPDGHVHRSSAGFLVTSLQVFKEGTRRYGDVAHAPPPENPGGPG